MAPLRRGIRAAGAGLPPEQIAGHVFPRMFGSARTPPMLADLLPLARRFGPDLLVHEEGELAAPLVAALLGVPHVTHAFGGVTPAEFVREAGERLTPLWAEHGLQVRPYAGCYEHLYLDICPPALQAVALDHIKVVQPLRPVSYTGEQRDPLPPLVTGDSGRPLVYLTLGTVSNTVEVLQPLVAAVASLEVRLLVTVGPAADPAALGRQPAHVAVERFVSQTAVLPLCALVVSHAGSGTVLGAAGLGLPQVCLPQAADQFRNTEGVVRAGAGVGLHPSDVSTEAVAGAVRAVLEGESYQTCAVRLRDEMAAMPSPDQVAVRLERLVSRGRGSRRGRA